MLLTQDGSHSPMNVVANYSLSLTLLAPVFSLLGLIFCYINQLEILLGFLSYFQLKYEGILNMKILESVP